MKTVKNISRQGDVMFIRVSEVPKEAKLSQSSKNGDVIVAHSETGHHHVFRKDSGVELYTTGDPHVCYLRMEQPAQLDHLRAWDTHESMFFSEPGCFVVKRHREETPEGWRMAQD